MDESTDWVVRAILVIVVFITIFAVVANSATSLGVVAPMLGVIAGLGALAALFGTLKMVVSWAQ